MALIETTGLVVAGPAEGLGAGDNVIEGGGLAVASPASLPFTVRPMVNGTINFAANDPDENIPGSGVLDGWTWDPDPNNGIADSTGETMINLPDTSVTVGLPDIPVAATLTYRFVPDRTGLFRIVIYGVAFQSSDDDLWILVDGVPITILQVNRGFYFWKLTNAMLDVPFNAGQTHEIQIVQRQDGTRVDRLFVSDTFWPTAFGPIGPAPTPFTASTPQDIVHQGGGLPQAQPAQALGSGGFGELVFPDLPETLPAEHLGEGDVVHQIDGLTLASPAELLGSASGLLDGFTFPQAGPAQALGSLDQFINATTLVTPGPASHGLLGEIIHDVTTPSVAGPAALIPGSSPADVIHETPRPGITLDADSFPQAGPAIHLGDGTTLKTISGLPQADPAIYIDGGDIVHDGVLFSVAGVARHIGSNVTVIKPDVEIMGVVVAGPAFPIGHVWQDPLHMQGIVYPLGRPSECGQPTAAEPAPEYVNFPESGVIFGPVEDRTCRSDYDPVKRLTVEGCYHLAVDKSVKVSFALRRDFTEPGPYVIELYRGRAINDDKWEKLAQVEDQSWLFDRRPQPRPHERSTYYRLRITDGDGTSYWCHPVSFDVVWNHYDWRLVKEIVRKELLVQGRRNGRARKRGAGTRGWLLKKRQFGDPCTRCLDENTGTPTDSNCPECLGTGVTGGFYPPLEYWVIQQPARRSTRLSDAGDTRTTVIESVRALAHPSPEAGDIWVSTAGDVRYEVQGDIEKLARHRGVDVILGLRLLELPTTAAAYNIPIEGMCSV